MRFIFLFIFIFLCAFLNVLSLYFEFKEYLLLKHKRTMTTQPPNTLYINTKRNTNASTNL